MALMVGLLIAGYTFVYASIKGANPWDVLVSAITGQPLDATLRSEKAASSVPNGTVTSVEGAAGIIENFHPGNDPDGNHQTHGHVACASSEMTIYIGLRLRARGFLVTGHSGFPPIGTHTKNSWHYVDRAIDYNWPGGNEKAKLVECATQIIPGLAREYERKHSK